MPEKAVWIVAEARREHVAAITWLNESAADFYLLKAEAIQIGGPPAALLLTRIVGPSTETKQVGAEKKDLVERHELRYRFWEGLLETAREFTTLHANVSPTQSNWLLTGSGRSGIMFGYTILQHASIPRRSGATTEPLLGGVTSRTRASCEVALASGPVES